MQITEFLRQIVYGNANDHQLPPIIEPQNKRKCPPRFSKQIGCISRLGSEKVRSDPAVQEVFHKLWKYDEGAHSASLYFRHPPRT